MQDNRHVSAMLLGVAVGEAIRQYPDRDSEQIQRYAHLLLLRAAEQALQGIADQKTKGEDSAG
jgi:hypothetical protein